MIGIIGRYDGNILKVPSSILKIIYENDMTPLIFSPKDQNYDTFFDKTYIDYLLKQVSGIIIPGGEAWTSMDSYILKKCIDDDICTLCICLGNQLLGLANDYIVEDRLELNNSNIIHNTKNKYAHNIFIKEDSLLYKIIGKNVIEVNSRHNFHVNNIIGKVDAYSADGYVEAIEIENKRFILGVQFHPEDLYDDVNIRKIFDYFFLKCRE